MINFGDVTINKDPGTGLVAATPPKPPLTLPHLTPLFISIILVKSPEDKAGVRLQNAPEVIQAAFDRKPLSYGGDVYEYRTQLFSQTISHGETPVTLPAPHLEIFYVKKPTRAKPKKTKAKKTAKTVKKGRKK